MGFGGAFMRNLLLSICYDGSRYHGWQIQKNAVSVQEVFQDALFKILNENCDIKGCSRTDSGVHANMYCVSVKVNSDIPCERLQMAMNRFLSADIAVNSAMEVPLDFHARYSCVGKEYIYKIWNRRVRNPFLVGRAFHYWYPLDLEKLRSAGQNFVGTHDFTSFCTFDSRNPENMVRTVNSFSIDGSPDGLVTVKVAADGFLYNMVRIMVGTLLHVSMGKIAPGQIRDIIEAKNRAFAGPTAVAHGLYLNKVFYDDNINLGLKLGEEKR